ncbi:AAA family ATPase [Citrobacter europaeus]|uniref:AAA family ATPase n=1 Tax=Citrobacter europaeus TaxID=1914243 RepID=UPI00388FC3E3
MFTRLRLTNFKAWWDTNSINLKPITMLLGTNSSGKSSLIQSLLLLKQTVESPDRTVHLNLGGDEVNDLFSFGSFEDVLNQRPESQRQFTIEFDFERKVSARVGKGEFFCSYGQTSSKSVAIESLKLSTNSRTFRATRREKGAFSIFLDEQSQPIYKGRNGAPERSIAFSVEAISAMGQDGQLVEDLSLSIRRELEEISYLGPLRRKPERDYPWNRTKPGDVGIDGKGAVDALLASALLRGEEQNYILNGVSKWLARMGIADRLVVRQQGRSNRYELIIERDEIESNLRDVGIGVSQVLPVLVIAYFSPKGSTIILEEPEIHLHPLAQAVLAEFFVEVSNERNIQFIVETHSEHLFRRMQTLISRETINPEDVGMYFVERGEAATLRRLEIDEFGRLHNWPQDFFGDALGETKEQAKLFFERNKASNQ